MAINLRAPFLLPRAAIGAMIDRGFGRIVLLSSVAAYTGGIVGPHYAASKAGRETGALEAVTALAKTIDELARRIEDVLTTADAAIGESIAA
jgi:NAD(P)-dependent dehydrogenase (short-subunit alcohol dehydrogenase family)